MRKVLSAQTLLAAVLMFSARAAFAQTPAAPIKVEFDEAVRRAIEKNPTVAQAATTISRAEAVLRQTRGTFMPSVSANLTNVTLNSSRGFDGSVTQPIDQFTISGDVSMPILAPSQWATAKQNRDQIEVATRQTSETKQQIGVAAAQAYLAVIAAHRQIEVDERAIEVARAHLDFATKRLEGGVGSRLNQLRAAQELSTEQSTLEEVRLALVRAQEALGVLMAENGPVDAITEPVFDIPATVSEAEWMGARPDVRSQQSVIAANDRVVRDSKFDWYPNASVSFAPLYVTPAALFQPSKTWRLAVSFTQSIYEGGQRSALKALRGVTLDQSRLAMTGIEIQARSEVRVAREAVERRRLASASAQLSATQAAEVLRITTAAYEVGATTNLEVIDAQRSARDAETQARRAEDLLRLANLDLLVALGRFPK